MNVESKEDSVRPPRRYSTMEHSKKEGKVKG